MKPPAPRNLLGMTRDELAAFALSNGEQRFRGAQLYAWLYAKGASSFSEMTDLAAAFRARLEEVASIRGVRLLRQQKSDRDGTIKFLFELHDGLSIESVLIPPAATSRGEDDDPESEETAATPRLTLCVSTQVGCPLDCAFCATGAMGFARNLDAGEIVDQVLQSKKLAGRAVTNVVFMGMGEPLLNYENVMKAADILSNGVGIAARRITISTAGIAPMIRRWADEGRKFRLAVSLHSAVDATRLRIMPITRKYPVDELRDAAAYYYRAAKQPATYEVIFFDGVNDSDAEVKALVRFARQTPSKINVIPFHAIDLTGLQGIAADLRPSPRIAAIVERLRGEHLTVMVRSSAGDDIAAACGQLASALPARRAMQTALQP